MSMPLDEAMEIAREAKEQGRLNRHPQALITLAEEVFRLRTLYEKEPYACSPGKQVDPPESPA